MPVLSSPSLSVANETRTSYTPALISLAILYFMMGFITCLNDSLVPFFKAGFNLSYTQSSLVQFYFFLTYAAVSIPAGKLVERIGFKNGMITGFAVAALGALLFYPASVYHAYYLFLAALFVLAIGIVVLQVSANPYITVLGPTETASSRLTLIQGIGSIGTTVAPLFGAAFILSSLKGTSASSEAVRTPYVGIAACLIVIAVILWKLRLPSIKMTGTAQKSSGILSYRNLKFGILGIFMYVGAEVSIGTFLTNYIVDKTGISTEAANNYVAFYWGSMLVGRMLGSLVLKLVRPSVMLSILSASALVLISVSLGTNGYASIWAMIAVGLCNSVMFAIVFSLSVEGLGSHTTRASGLLSTAIAGGAIVSFAQGVLKDHFSWPIAFIIPLICYVYLLFYGLNGYKPKKTR